jgi:hypothetical protein
MRFNATIVVPVAVEILREHHPMTLRQVFYRLVARQLIENRSQHYDSLSKALVRARQDGTIPWEWIEDRLRWPHEVPMWASIADFGADVVEDYRRDVWTTQPRYFELWCEKDALSGIFQQELWRYGVTFNIGRGYDSWTVIKDTAARLAVHDHPLILYFGDFDPSGEHMVVSLEERLQWFDLPFELQKMALTRQDIDDYQLPADFTKVGDTRAAAHIAKYGDIAVELDALPVEVLRERIVECVEANMDLAALARVRKRETADRRKIKRLLGV